MKLVSFIVMAMTVGCSKMATVPLNLSAAQNSQIGAVAQKIELKHEDDGWVKVKTNVGDAKMSKLANGQKVQVAMAEVPKGRYTAVRATFMAPGKETTKGFGSGGAGQPAGNQGKGMVSYTVNTKTEFCAKGKKDNDLTVTIRQVNPADEPTIKVNQRPACK
ncbi:MAG: hypothetical protein AAGA48_09870 [Myxococcota bacterium]